MPIDTVRSVRPLVDFVDRIDIPLIDFLEIGAAPILDDIMVANAWTNFGPNGFVLGAEFNFPSIIDLHLPGLDQFSLSFNQDAFAKGEMSCGPEPSLVLEDLEITLRIDPAILSARDGSGATISTSCTLVFDRDGFHFLTFSKASLSQARIGGTDIEVTLEDICVGDSAEAFLTVRAGTLILPMFTDSAGAPLQLNGTNIVFGRDGLSGSFAKLAGLALPVTLYEFTCELERAELTLEQSQLVSVDLGGRLDLSAFLSKGGEDGWVAVDFSVGPAGMIAALSSSEALINMSLDGMFSLDVDSIRLETGGSGGAGTLWLSGELTPDIDGVEGGWPSFAFDEIGIGPSGGLRLAEGARIATTQPFVLKWTFLKLTVTAFSLERPEGAPDDLELHISAAVEVLQGLPAGASVEGLVVRRYSGGRIAVRFNGIGLKFASPGAYAFSATVAWDDTRNALSGTGYLDVESLDMRLDVVFASSSERVNGDDVTTLFLAAEAQLVPGGIPIAATGLSLYGVSGLLAHNMALTLPDTGQRRYFDAFQQNPQGFSALSKWHPERNAHSIGLGVVIGTADDGWLFSARGALLLSIEDLTLVVTATGEMLKERSPMNATNQGKLAAVLAVYPTTGLLRLDFEAEWHNGDLFEVDANGGGEFHVNRPLDFSVWLGKAPELGKPVAVRAIKLDGNWLMSAEYWFGLDAARAANIGMRSKIELKAGSDSVYAELVVSADSRALLSWKPEQLEGMFKLRGRARLVGGGLSLSLSVSAGAQLTIASPKYIEIPLQACIEIDLVFDTIRLCLEYTFTWREDIPPQLEPVVQGLNAVPRHWMPRPNTDDHPVDDGIFGHVSDQGSATITLGTVHPHSVLVLECSKSLRVALAPGVPVQLNDVAVPLPQSIGKNSGWLSQWSLTELELLDVTVGRPVDLFGTFSRSPVTREDKQGKVVSARPPNTELRLLSSRRFGQDGSNGGGGAEETPPVDCSKRPTTKTLCVPLSDLKMGVGRLKNGWIYRWSGSPDNPYRDNRYGVGLGVEDEFLIYPPEGIAAIDVTLVQYIPNRPPVPNTSRVDHQVVTHPIPVGYRDREWMLEKLCWEKLIADDGSGSQSDWQGSSGTEEWTVAASRRLLIPGHVYQLAVSIVGQTLRGTNAVGAPLTTRRLYNFTAGRAPDWKDGLVRAIAGVYPNDGLRPAFRDYDLLVHFHDDYFDALYTLDKRILGVRLRDANGNRVSGPDGHVLLPTHWEPGTLNLSPIERWWGAARIGDPGMPCEVGPPPPESGNTVLPIALKDLHLLPDTRYSAELVAVDRGAGDVNPTAPLARWSFTTSRFANFEALATPPSHIPALGLVQIGLSSSTDFTSLIQAFGAPAVAVVAETRITPVRVENELKYLLIEAPEPLDDTAERLSVKISGNNAALALIPNLDRTRIIAVLSPPRPLTAPAEKIDVMLNWQAAPSGAPNEARRTIYGVATDVKLVWRIPLGKLF
ncbi:hypothetical protein [Pseudomonas frederiksbergensis]|uniref:hypothetical protein n=1 Tax=Pseudomonas frederiksbergensis TaxID=104087 RepID=UPI003D236DD8